MPPDQFVKVFDILDSGYRTWTFAAPGLIGVAVGVAIVLFPRIARALGILYMRTRSRWERVFYAVFLGLALFWTIAAFLMTYAVYLGHLTLARDNACRMVEGPVEELSPLPYSGSGTESFSVRGVRFSYTDFDTTNGFNRTSARGGPIDAKSYVRICYDPASNTILRLEIRGFAGEPKDYGKPIPMFLDAEEARRLMGDYSPPEAPWQIGLFFAIYFLDLLATFALFAPYLRTFPRLRAMVVPPQAVPLSLKAHTRVPLANSVIYWDRGDRRIWLRQRGFSLFQATRTVAALTIEPQSGTVGSVDLHYSSGAPVATPLFFWGIYQMFSDAFPAEGQAHIPLAVVGGLATVVLVFGVFGLRKELAEVELLARDALGELARK
jgi:hypothetical protein